MVKNKNIPCHNKCHKECQECKTNVCCKPIEHTCCRWSEFRPLNPRDEELLFIALKGYCGNDFIPLLVSTKVCEGYNYIYLAEKINHCSCEVHSLVYIQVYLMHCGKIKLVSIKDAHIYPETSNECFPIHCVDPCHKPYHCGS